MERVSGIRKFSSAEIDALYVIDCLKKSGMEIRDIKQFMQWCTEGPSTYDKRKELFETRKRALEKELQELEKNMAMIRFKCWYYDKAIADGNEDGVRALLPDKLPAEIQKLYDLAHSAE